MVQVIIITQRDRAPNPAPETSRHMKRYPRKMVSQEEITDEEIVDRCILATNEGC